MQMHARDADQWAERAKIAENELAKEQAVSEKLRDNDRYAAIICKEIRNESKEWKQRAEAAEKALDKWGHVLGCICCRPKDGFHTTTSTNETRDGNLVWHRCPYHDPRCREGASRG